MNGFLGNFNNLVQQNPMALLGLSAGLLGNPRNSRAALSQGFQGFMGGAQNDLLNRRQMMADQRIANQTARELERERAQMQAARAMAADLGYSGPQADYYAQFPSRVPIPKGDEYGLTPFPVTGPGGQLGLGQISRSGDFRPVEMGGYKYAPGLRKEQEATGTATGKIRGEVATNLPAVEIDAQETFRLIDEVRNDPALSSLNPVTASLPNALGGNLDLQQRVDQLKGRAFMSAYEALKGGGQITENETAQAVQAMFRASNAQTVGSFLEALDDFESAVRMGLDKMRAKMGQPTQTAPPAQAASPQVADPLGIR